MLDDLPQPDCDSVIAATSSPTWIVVNTHAHREQLAIDNLERQNYTVYCPMVNARIRHARKTIDVRRPLFRGYVFVDVTNARWRPVISTLGVRTVVRNGDEPATLDHRVVASLRQREVDGVIVRPAAPFRIGQEVRVTGGPLDGLVAKIISLNDKDRVTVLLDFLNRSIKARVTVEQLRD